MQPEFITTPAQAKKLLGSVSTLALDCDGVIWEGSSLLPSVASLFRLLSSPPYDIQLLFVSNASHRTRTEFLDKMVGLVSSELSDDETISFLPDQFYCPSWGVAEYLRECALDSPSIRDGKVFVIGFEALCQELESAGFDAFRFGSGSDVYPGHDEFIRQRLRPGVSPESPENVGTVVVGYDHHLDYGKIAFATTCLLRRDVRFLVTDDDIVFPWCDPEAKHKKFRLPGTGAYVQSIAAASSRSDAMIIGKPSTFLLERMIADHGVDRSKMLVVGDSLRCDILMSNSGGVRSVLVFSGSEVKEETLPFPEDAKIRPTYLMDDLATLYRLLTQADE